MDTQWPRYIVFDQFSPAEPHEYAGSVHASDAEMALLLARDVFARRPDHVSMWVARAEDVSAWTREEIKDGGQETGDRGQEEEAASGVPSPQENEDYCVFVKAGHKAPVVYQGVVQAAAPEAALRAALGLVPLEQAVLWWVIPQHRIFASQAQDNAAFYRPAHDKPYRDQSFYHVVSLMRAIKQARRAQAAGTQTVGTQTVGTQTTEEE